ncbi:ABC transporter ATP-binding protein [Agromyces seonyuensis]|uniref:ATP-binding cassette domain-containing protein n=1 Tax=Agromyces seonyuensis TaxID=2662446 RepID=A0A6I4NXZ6_9MICO|nr:ABC transporter ATP-binding protein [Agromyces seonyuensis]MWB99240.1 ATP-binding cassette domain-containing protein [Agromyces seonyuensis]
MSTQLEDAVQPGPVVVDIAEVSKRFTIRKDNSLKERIVTLGRAGRQHREDFWALRGVTTEVRAGQTIGLIGHNGSGKSTLLKVIGGIIEPSSGSVSRRGRIAALLELGAGFHPDLTGRENVYLNGSVLGLGRDEISERFDDIVAFSGIGDFIDTQVKFYSSGMYVRLAFAVAVHTDPDLLLVDEVLAVGDEAFQRKCLDKIRSFQQEGRTIVLVSHSLGQVAELCDRVILLNQGEVVVDGEPLEAIAAFRDILEDRRVAEVGSDGVPPRQVARVISGEVSVQGRAPGEHLRPGDDIVITSTFEHDEGIDDWVCAIQIDNEHGQVIYGASTIVSGYQLERLEGRRAVDLTIADARFGEGKYFVNVSLMDFAGRHLHDIPQATSFTVRTEGHSRGPVFAEPSFELRPKA